MTWRRYGRVEVGDGPIMRRRCLEGENYEWIVTADWISTAKGLGRQAHDRTLIVGLGCGYTLAEALKRSYHVEVLERDRDVCRAWYEDPRTLPRGLRAWVALHCVDLVDFVALGEFDVVLADIADRGCLERAKWADILRTGGELICPAFVAPLPSFVDRGGLRPIGTETVESAMLAFLEWRGERCYAS